MQHLTPLLQEMYRQCNYFIYVNIATKSTHHVEIEVMGKADIYGTPQYGIASMLHQMNPTDIFPLAGPIIPTLGWCFHMSMYLACIIIILCVLHV